MARKTYICPHCNVQVKDLKGHIARKHPEKVDNTEIVEPKSAPKAQRFEIKPDTKKENEAVYHCVDCGGSLTKGVAQCPGCGTNLDWGQL